MSKESAVGGRIGGKLVERHQNSGPFGYDVYHRFKGEPGTARVDRNRMIE